MNTKTIFFSLGVILLLSCNKEKRYSTKLQKGETWQVIEVSVDGTNTQLFGQWKVTSDTDISEQVPELTWTTPNIGNAQFQWQFQDKGKAFQLNYKLLCEECEGSLLDSLDYIANDLTGKYDVERHGRNKMEFVSSQTTGYPSKSVTIKIERKK